MAYGANSVPGKERNRLHYHDGNTLQTGFYFLPTRSQFFQFFQHRKDNDIMMRSVLGLLFVGLLFVFPGCGQKGHGLKVEYVEGIVTLDGQPLAGVSVTFIPKSEGGGAEAASGFSNEKGVYKLSSMNGDPEKGAVAGEYVVNVSKVEVDDPKAGVPYEQAVKMTNVVVQQKQLLPAVYQDRRTSPLSFTVNKGKNKIDIELKSNP